MFHNQLYKQYSNVCIGNRVPAVYRIGEREHFLSLSYISHTDNVIAFRKEPCPVYIRFFWLCPAPVPLYLFFAALNL